MSLVQETVATPLASALNAGIQSVSLSASVTFTQYTQQILAPDGYVFWVASATSATYPGSLHYSTAIQQDVDQTAAYNEVLFTTASEITEFNTESPYTMWIGTFPTGGDPLKVAFRGRGRFYDQASVWHYHGDAVYAALESQLVASPNDLPVGPIVSNSLPIWLAQNANFPVYPSFLVPQNVVPPYIVADIPPEDTVSLCGFPAIVGPPVKDGGGTVAPFWEWSATQLLRDKVKLIMYGLTNLQAVQFLTSLMDLSGTDDTFGFCNSPSIRDCKRTQPEIQAIAMRKELEIDASYYLNTADAFARRYILSAAITTTT